MHQLNKANKFSALRIMWKKKSFVTLSIITADLFSLCLSQISPPEVTTPSGYTYIGINESFDDADISTFMGIPYAEPPLGDRRFRTAILKEAPADADLSETRIDATENGSKCLALNDISSEDCLTLNIWTPRNSTAGDNLPVLFFIHGGGFIMGGHSPDRNNGKSFALNEVILVTVQYRLHWLGNFDLKPIFGRRKVKDQDENLALEDQRVALRWVHNNIEAFGGNSQNITISGFSSGAGCVMAHMASTASAPLFHKAFVQSGSHIITSTLSTGISWRVLLQVILPIERLYKCGSRTLFNADCLGQVGLRADLEWWQNASTDILLQVMNESIAVIPDTIGSIATGRRLSVSDIPSKVLENTDISSEKPLLMGVTMDEGYWLYPAFASYPGLDANDPDCGTLDTSVEPVTTTLLATDIIIEDPTNSDRFGRRGNWTRERATFSIIDELLFGIPTRAMLEAHKGPKYSYLYDLPLFFGYDCKGTGTPHGADSKSIFGVDISWWDLPEMHENIINFIKTGNPGSVSVSGETLDWDQYDANGDRYTMILSDELRFSNDAFGRERERISELLLVECMILTPINAFFIRPVCLYNPAISLTLSIISRRTDARELYDRAQRYIKSVQL